MLTKLKGLLKEYLGKYKAECDSMQDDKGRVSTATRRLLRQDVGRQFLAACVDEIEADPTCFREKVHCNSW